MKTSKNKNKQANKLNQMENQIEELRKQLCSEIEGEQEMSPETKMYIKSGINLMAKRMGNIKIISI